MPATGAVMFWFLQLSSKESRAPGQAETEVPGTLGCSAELLGLSKGSELPQIFSTIKIF